MFQALIIVMLPLLKICLLGFEMNVVKSVYKTCYYFLSSVYFPVLILYKFD